MDSVVATTFCQGEPFFEVTGNPNKILCILMAVVPLVLGVP